MWPSFLRFAIVTSGVAVLITLLAWSQTEGSSADLPPGPVQAKATTACTECHDARIILQQRLTKAAWTKEVDKMVKWGAVVDPADRDGFIDYFSSNFPPEKPPYVPVRSKAIRTRTK